jgi:membrane protein
MLALFYKLTPNTKVEFSAAVVGGVVAGAAWHFYNQLGFLLASRAVSANKFYGGLFLVVLLMSGLYIIWLILLFGAQVAYAYQNRAAYLQDRLADNINQRGREFVALRLMTCLGQRFQSEFRPVTVLQLSTELGIPSRLTQSVLRTLCATRLVTEVSGTEAAFTPARPLEAINAYDILLAMRTGTGQELPLCAAAGMAEIYGEFARIEQAERTAATTITLRALVNRLPQTAALPEPVPAVTKAAIVGGPGVLPVVEVKTTGPVEPVAAAEIENMAVAVAKAEPPEPVPGKNLPRRETVMPAETDFPL